MPEISRFLWNKWVNHFFYVIYRPLTLRLSQNKAADYAENPNDKRHSSWYNSDENKKRLAAVSTRTAKNLTLTHRQPSSLFSEYYV